MNDTPTSASFAARLADPRPLLAVELRPPRRDLEGARAMDAWMDVHRAVARLSNADTAIFLTDSAVGAGEEEGMAHLAANLGPRAVRERIVPFLTLKHPLDYCLRCAARARRERFPALVVLGGDKRGGPPRCLPHAFELRERLRREQPALLLGGWANPNRDPRGQARLLAEHRAGADFALSQVLSHHQIEPVAEFMDEAARLGVDLPLFAGVFFYRSGRPSTLAKLADFIPVPAEELKRDFGERRLDAEEVAVQTLLALAKLGFKRYYISNVPTGDAPRILARLAAAAGLPDPFTAPPFPRGGGGLDSNPWP